MVTEMEMSLGSRLKHAWNVFKANEIITNTIYFYKTTGNAGIGELVINADKFIF